MSQPIQHDWDLSPKGAVQLQKQLREQIVIQPYDQPIQRIGGADISYNRFSDVIYAGIVVLDYVTQLPLYSATVLAKMRFPYIPGLLSFREIPAIYRAWEALPEKPDVIMIDGHGINHPRRLGIAAHFGLVSGHPSLGCAKKHLCGTFIEPPRIRGHYSTIEDKGERIGYVLCTKDKVKPVWTSPGHLIGMEQSAKITLHCARGYRIPEPTRQAHLLVNAFRRGEIEPGVRWLTDE